MFMTAAHIVRLPIILLHVEILLRSRCLLVVVNLVWNMSRRIIGCGWEDLIQVGSNSHRTRLLLDSILLTMVWRGLRGLIRESCSFYTVVLVRFLVRDGEIVFSLVIS